MSYTFRYCLVSIIIMWALSFSGTAQAQTKGTQEPPPPLIEQVRSVLGSDYLHFGLIIQSQADVHLRPQSEGVNSFSLPVVFFRTYGDLGSNFSYFFQLSATSSPALVDGFITYRNGPVMLRAGAFRPEISEESLIPIPITDFIDRSRIVNRLVHRRDLGITGTYSLTPDLSFNLGMYNGTNIDIPNNNNSFFYTSRLNFNRSVNDDLFVHAAATAATGEENGTVVANGYLPPVYGRRTIYGGDVRIEYGNVLLSSEFLHGNLEYGQAGSFETDEVYGFHITGGYNVTEYVELLLRLDHFSSEVISEPETNILLGGVDYNFNSTTSFRFNYKLNPDGFTLEDQYFLAMLQLWF